MPFIHRDALLQAKPKPERAGLQEFREGSTVSHCVLCLVVEETRLRRMH